MFGLLKFPALRTRSVQSSSLLLIAPASITVQHPTTLSTRGKRTKGKNSIASQGTQRIVSQLSVLSASRKQPRRLKLVNEDLVRHQVVHNAWALFQKQKREIATERLNKQYEGIENALNDLKIVSPALYRMGTKVEKSKRFSLELRTPTEYPPNEVWNHNYVKKTEE